MNPLSLLTKGQTLKGLGRPGRYKLSPQCALPNFQAPRRRMVAVPTVSTPPVAEVKQASLFEQVPVAPEPAVVEAPPLAEQIPASQPVVSGSPFAVKAPKLAAPCGPSLWKRLVGGAKDGVQRLILGDKRRPTPGTGVQTELALEKVRVMRSNLDEDDLEVVLVQRKVGMGGKPLARVSKMEMTGEAWVRLTAPFRKRNNGSASSLVAEKKEPAELGAPVLAEKS
jgi:hypothetical protein